MSVFLQRAKHRKLAKVCESMHYYRCENPKKNISYSTNRFMIASPLYPALRRTRMVEKLSLCMGCKFHIL
ncbi:hypothetical protein FKM82_006626 [Ascaphus truei]